MACCCVRDARDAFFSTKIARRDLRRYLAKGPDRTTLMLLDAVAAAGGPPRSLLDVGGGIGTIQLELLSRGTERATHVEISSGYQRVAEEEAARRNLSERVRFVRGDLAELAGELPTAAAVTLDRVVCCYPDPDRLLGAAASRCGDVLALAFPRGRWHVRAGIRVLNLFLWLKRDEFRTFAHPPETLAEILEEWGFERVSVRETFVWQVEGWRRRDAA